MSIDWLRITVPTSATSNSDVILTATYTPDSAEKRYSTATVTQTIHITGTATPTMAWTTTPTSTMTTTGTNQVQTVSVTLTGSGGLGTPTGTVTFTSANNNLDTCSVAGQALTSGTVSCVLTARTVTPTGSPVRVTATYNGDGNYSSQTVTADITIQ
jgi:trimeric autotransporter adhesin